MVCGDFKEDYVLGAHCSYGYCNSTKLIEQCNSLALAYQSVNPTSGLVGLRRRTISANEGRQRSASSSQQFSAMAFMAAKADGCKFVFN